MTTLIGKLPTGKEIRIEHIDHGVVTVKRRALQSSEVYRTEIHSTDDVMFNDVDKILAEISGHPLQFRECEDIAAINDFLLPYGLDFSDLEISAEEV